MVFRQAFWDEPLIFEIGRKGRIGHSVPEASEDIKKAVGDVINKLPEKIRRKTPPNLPEVSEVEVVNHYTRLSQMNYGVDLGLYPLGSCTMKYNPRINEAVASLEGFSWIHPYQDEETVQGALELLYKLQKWTAEITGTDVVTLQPAAGAHAELTGVLIIRQYHKFNGELEKRNEIIVPDSAHGTNPASTAMAGFRVIEIPSGKDGCVDLDALKSAVSEHTAGFMLTNPNTLGLFESEIEEIAKIIHEAGGLLYYDGANLNANLMKTRPGDMGFDIVHVNYHKTFSTPHGGGGPGAGAIGVKKFLEEYLPVPIVEYDKKRNKYYLDYNKSRSIGKIKAFYGNFLVLVRAFAYILSMGKKGLEKVAEDSVLCANYLGYHISKIDGFELPYAPEKPRKHEVVISAEPLLEKYGIKALDVSKRLLDFGFHAPTNYFPLIVHEALMIEPTESYDKQTLDKYIEAFRQISREAKENPDVLKRAPTNTSKRRLDVVAASKPKTMILTWRMYKKLAESSK
ncbi:MAG: aminomethyl-transferring glycine dehydrogenase subunit GcvPB [Candidatus Odinarchaeota archaeon]|nr:aminomethyl-transferring glycine dehydrogenase subunit GcvPB [Candidatus Odinarchaeota archaeon]